MAESISVFLWSGSWGEVEASLDKVCHRIRPDLWGYPLSQDYLVTAYQGAVFEDYEDDEKAIVTEMLSGRSAMRVFIEMRGSKGILAVDGAEQLARILLNHFGGFVEDDCPDKSFWTWEEIASGVEKKGGGFLDCHRARLA